MTFDQTTTAAEVIDGVDLTGRVAVITGASGGIGLETARALASAGATVVLGNRPTAKSESAAAELRAAGASVQTGDLDLASLATVRAFAKQVLTDHDGIDILVNNAGIMAAPLGRTADGFELQLGTNHLGHFVLSNLLRPALGDGARVVTVSSLAHMISGIIWDDPNYDRVDYDAMQAYAQSKSANILFAIALDQRLASGAHAYSVHPGVVETDLFRFLPAAAVDAMKERSAAQGLATKTPAKIRRHTGAVAGKSVRGEKKFCLDRSRRRQSGAGTRTLSPTRPGSFCPAYSRESDGRLSRDPLQWRDRNKLCGLLSLPPPAPHGQQQHQQV